MLLCFYGTHHNCLTYATEMHLIVVSHNTEAFLYYRRYTIVSASTDWGMYTHSWLTNRVVIV